MRDTQSIPKHTFDVQFRTPIIWQAAQQSVLSDLTRSEIKGA